MLSFIILCAKSMLGYCRGSPLDIMFHPCESAFIDDFFFFKKKVICYTYVYTVIRVKKNPENYSALFVCYIIIIKLHNVKVNHNYL